MEFNKKQLAAGFMHVFVPVPPFASGQMTNELFTKLNPGASTDRIGTSFHSPDDLLPRLLLTAWHELKNVRRGAITIVVDDIYVHVAKNKEGLFFGLKEWK